MSSPGSQHQHRVPLMPRYHSQVRLYHPCTRLCRCFRMQFSTFFRHRHRFARHQIMRRRGLLQKHTAHRCSRLEEAGVAARAVTRSPARLVYLLWSSMHQACGRGADAASHLMWIMSWVRRSTCLQRSPTHPHHSAQPTCLNVSMLYTITHVSGHETGGTRQQTAICLNPGKVPALQRSAVVR